ncbi:hypothetical protein DL766_009718 [Monosporascus sp. MC13-8B]|uniref:Tetraspanin n=1 Tax=Monosporascus cannonballus TaxID=155416 RepID=A0ABY0GXQ3_9PEZI|nr:hypothetical protein DL762_009338 [Monosporascus cannonballus]RYO90067.1 hypothetical protein DL763_005434 [Monosporascus cannonballus]RYP14288.1 hypothetical protein DL766_009718 [Monosporascus sp. MC13-8B]
MVKLVVIYLLITAALVAIAIYVQVNSSVLSLPVSTGTTVLAIVLPLLAIVNFFYSPVLQRILQRRTGSSASSTREFAPQALQLLQFALVVVLLTVSSESFLPGSPGRSTLACSLEGAWQRLWSVHDGRAIERIQDAFNCCGFNSVRDRAWPPHNNRDNQDNQCSVLYRRSTPCVGPWRAAMQRDAGLEFVVAAAVGVLQLVQLVLSRLRVARNGGSRGYRQITHRGSADQEEGLVANEEDGANHVGGEEDDDADTPRRNYGAIDEGRTPRIEPSHLGEERNHWRS